MNLARRIETLEASAAFMSPDMGPMPTLEEMAGGHLRQLAFTQACQTKRRVVIQCARQVGKSWGLGEAMIRRGQAFAGTTSVLFGLNGVAVRENFWAPIVKTLLNRFRVRCELLERMIVTFPNGSRIICTGTDDLQHIQNVLGNRFKGAILAVDECQSQKPAVLKTLLTGILPPALTPESTVILSGTISEVPGGYWHDLGQADSWEQHGWGRVELTEPMPEGLSFDDQIAHLENHLVSLNPHTPEAPAVLIQHLKDNRLTIADPQIQRDWFGNKNAFDHNARTYRYRPEVNLYTPAARPLHLADLPESVHRKTEGFVCAAPLPGIDTFSFAIDPGAGDPCGITGIGWDSTGKQKLVQQVFAWASTRDHNLPESAMFGVAAVAQRVFPTRHWRIDNTGKQDLDHLQHQFGLPVVKAVDRSKFEASLNRANDLLQTGAALIIDDPENPLLTDFLNARLDKEALARGTHKWSATYHPTCSEMYRACLAAYWPPVPPKAKADVPSDPFDRVMAKQVAEMKKRPRLARFTRRSMP